MAKSKTGPPYSGRSAEYILVTNPWGMNRDSKSRGSKDFDRLGAWIQYMLSEKGIDAAPECVYTRGTKDEVIVQLPYGTDIQPLLGEHRWALIVKKWDGNPNDRRASCIFEYNFRNNGDPGNHNWAEQYPDPQGIPVPAKSPYPTPSWTEPPGSIRSLVLPIPPRPLPEPEPIPTVAPALQETTPPHPRVPDQASSLSQPDSTPPPRLVNNTSVFRPYEPPTQHPAHGTFIHQTNQPGDISAHQYNRQIDTPVKEECITSLKYIKKLDPYQEEQEAQALLKTPPRDSHGGFKLVTEEPVKRELTDTGCEPKYQPSSELMDAIDSLIQEQNEDQKAAVNEAMCMAELRPGPSSYRPSTELVDAINSLVQDQGFDQKPLSKEASIFTVDPLQIPHYQPSAELTDAINNFIQQSIVREEEPKPVLDPQPQKRKNIIQGGRPETKEIKLEDA